MARYLLVLCVFLFIPGNILFGQTLSHINITQPGITIQQVTNNMHAFLLPSDTGEGGRVTKVAAFNNFSAIVGTLRSHVHVAYQQL